MFSKRFKSTLQTQRSVHDSYDFLAERLHILSTFFFYYYGGYKLPPGTVRSADLRNNFQAANVTVSFLPHSSQTVDCQTFFFIFKACTVKGTFLFL